jgi:hypothetical protein
VQWDRRSQAAARLASVSGIKKERNERGKEMKGCQSEGAPGISSAEGWIGRKRVPSFLIYFFLYSSLLSLALSLSLSVRENARLPSLGKFVVRSGDGGGGSGSSARDH